MGADGGTLCTSGIVPEVIMKIYSDARAGNWDEVKRIQFKLLDLFLPIIHGPNLVEGVRIGYELRGFNPGRARFPLSASEQRQRNEMRSRIACVLAECGFAEAAHACEQQGDFPDPQLRAAIEEIVRRVIKLQQ
jgi:dihydrodipicolinate synthase/N-acetylneuraminate lyase